MGLGKERREIKGLGYFCQLGNVPQQIPSFPAFFTWSLPDLPASCSPRSPPGWRTLPPNSAPPGIHYSWWQTDRGPQKRCRGKIHILVSPVSGTWGNPRNSQSSGVVATGALATVSRPWLPNRKRPGKSSGWELLPRIQCNFFFLGTQGSESTYSSRGSLGCQVPA